MLKEKILNELEKNLIFNHRTWDEGTVIHMEVTEGEKEEFINTEIFNCIDYFWEFEDNILILTLLPSYYNNND